MFSSVFVLSGFQEEFLEEEIGTIDVDSSLHLFVDREAIAPPIANKYLGEQVVIDLRSFSRARTSSERHPEPLSPAISWCRFEQRFNKLAELGIQSRPVKELLAFRERGYQIILRLRAEEAMTYRTAHRQITAIGLHPEQKVTFFKNVLAHLFDHTTYFDIPKRHGLSKEELLAAVDGYFSRAGDKYLYPGLDQELVSELGKGLSSGTQDKDRLVTSCLALLRSQGSLDPQFLPTIFKDPESAFNAIHSSQRSRMMGYTFGVILIGVALEFGPLFSAINCFIVWKILRLTMQRDRAAQAEHLLKRQAYFNLCRFSGPYSTARLPVFRACLNGHYSSSPDTPEQERSRSAYIDICSLVRTLWLFGARKLQILDQLLYSVPDPENGKLRYLRALLNGTVSAWHLPDTSGCQRVHRALYSKASLIYQYDQYQARQKTAEELARIAADKT